MRVRLQQPHENLRGVDVKTRLTVRQETVANAGPLRAMALGPHPRKVEDGGPAVDEGTAAASNLRAACRSHRRLECSIEVVQPDFTLARTRSKIAGDVPGRRTIGASSIRVTGGLKESSHRVPCELRRIQELNVEILKIC